MKGKSGYLKWGLTIFLTVCGAADPDYRPEQPEDPGQPEKPEQPANPGVKTGDSGVLLYMGLMLLALTGSAWVLRKKRAR